MPPTNRTIPGSAGGKTTCNYELPGDTCNSSGYRFVQCKVAQDCATETKQPLKGLTCGGAVVDCLSGICRAPNHGALCMQLATPPSAVVDGGLVAELNVQTGVGGLLYVELLDPATDQPLPGFGLAEAKGVRGNYVRGLAARWGGGSSLDGLSGRVLRMRVTMTDAKLYSVSFKCAAAV